MEKPDYSPQGAKEESCTQEGFASPQPAPEYGRLVKLGKRADNLRITSLVLGACACLVLILFYFLYRAMLLDIRASVERAGEDAIYAVGLFAMLIVFFLAGGYGIVFVLNIVQLVFFIIGQKKQGGKKNIRVASIVIFCLSIVLLAVSFHFVGKA